MKTCGECGTRSYGDRWRPGEFLLFGNVFVCSVRCGEAWAAAWASDGCKPGQPGFALEEPGKPCRAYPSDAEYKTVGLSDCPDCGSAECWLHYLRWERRLGIDLNRAEWEGLP